MTKRIFILTDSLPLPRTEPEECKWQDTWPCLLKNDGYEIYSVSIGGATVGELSDQLDYHNSQHKDIVLLQTGIVDAAPRILTKQEREVVNYFWISRKLLLPLILKFKTTVRRRRNKTYTSPGKFRSTLFEIKNKVNCDRVYAVGIIPPLPGYENLAPGIRQNIHEYNGILAEVFGEGFLDTSGIPIEGIMSDFHHLNAAGHRYIYGIIKERIER